jgi:hypothetical protein
MSSGERKTNDFLAGVTARDLQARLRLEAKDLRVKVWKRRGGLDGALVCALCCDSTPVTHQKEKHPHHDREHLDGCHRWDLAFCTNAVSKRAGRTLMLCEFWHEGEWMRFGCRVFKVVRLSQQLFLVGCDESII